MNSVTFNGTLVYPAGDGGVAIPQLPVDFADAFESRSVFDLKFAVGGTHVIDFGTITPAAKVVAVVLPPDATGLLAPVMLRLNGASPGLELSPKGVFLYYNPGASAQGLTQMSVVATTAGRVLLHVLG